MVAGETQHKISCALFNITVKPFHRRPSRAGETRLTLFHKAWALAVIGRQKFVDAALRPGRVFVDGEGQVDGRLHVARIASGLARDSLHLAPPLAPALRIGTGLK